MVAELSFVAVGLVDHQGSIRHLANSSYKAGQPPLEGGGVREFHGQEGDSQDDLGVGAW